MAFIYSFLLFAAGFLGNRVDTGFIDWNPEKKLAWPDFKQRPDPGSPNAALTSTTIKFDYSYSEGKLKTQIRCQFDMNRSWGRIRNDYILSHEQGHFDIAEIFTRKLHRALMEYKPNEKTLSKDVNGIYQEMMRNCHDTQVQYDTETRFSLEKEKQGEWSKKIKDELKALEAFENYR
jgi:predicted secreted Zn-dependent protease